MSSPDSSLRGGPASADDVAGARLVLPKTRRAPRSTEQVEHARRRFSYFAVLPRNQEDRAGLLENSVTVRSQRQAIRRTGEASQVRERGLKGMGRVVRGRRIVLYQRLENSGARFFSTRSFGSSPALPSAADRVRRSGNSIFSRSPSINRGRARRTSFTTIIRPRGFFFFYFGAIDLVHDEQPRGDGTPRPVAQDEPSPARQRAPRRRRRAQHSVHRPSSANAIRST